MEHDLRDSFDTFWREHARQLGGERDALRNILDKLADGYRAAERAPMIRTLRKSGFNMRQIAAIMQLSRPTIYNILKEEECREILQIRQPENSSA